MEKLISAEMIEKTLKGIAIPARGSPPFRGESIFATVMMHFNDEPPTLKSRVPDEYFPPRLEELIQKSMAKDPDQRFQSMTEMAQALAAIKDTLTRNLSSKNRGAAATGTAGSSNMQIDMRVRGGETTKYAKIRPTTDDG